MQKCASIIGDIDIDWDTKDVNVINDVNVTNDYNIIDNITNDGVTVTNNVTRQISHCHQ